MPQARLDSRRLAENRIVTIARADPAHIAFDMLRTKLMKILRQHNWTSVAITSPTAGCGKTTTAVNLAFSLAKQREWHTVLVDLDLRRPQVGKLLGMNQGHSVEDYLKGRREIAETFVRYGDNLAIGATRTPVNGPAELLQDHDTAIALDALKRRLSPDVVIYDLPPMLLNDDLLAFLPNVDCVLLVVAAETSTLAEIDICERDLAEESKLLGVVLNKCRHTPEKYGY